MKATGIILAGGENRRIKTPKAFIELSSPLSLIDVSLNIFKKIFSETIIVTNDPEPYRGFATKVVEDLIKKKGPLGGIFTGVCFSTSELNFVVACDMPFINSHLIKYIIQKPEEYDIVIPEMGGKVESLFARYSKRSLPVIFSHLEKGQLKIKEILPKLRVLKITPGEIERFDPNHLSFFNINTPEDLKKAKDLLFKQSKKSKDPNLYYCHNQRRGKGVLLG